MMEKKSTQIDIIYGIEDKPRLPKGIPLALQHILAMFTANITVPLLLAGLLGMGNTESTFLIQCALLVAGVTTLLQIRKNKLIGSGLPIVMGTSNAFLPTVLAIGRQYGIGAVYGAAFVGGFFEAFLGKNLIRLKKNIYPLGFRNCSIDHWADLNSRWHQTGCWRKRRYGESCQPFDCRTGFNRDYYIQSKQK